ncbi:MAG: radical SAM protein [Candidatus Latescibacterota bacterium]|nr:MAG: radical SAM protein [Candidatus Latescibacterota bacterium]
MRRPGAVLLVSCYELGRPPQSVAWALGFLTRAGFAPAVQDLAVESLDTERVRQARFVAISVPMHTALRIGMQVARRFREINEACTICFFGHYAILHAEMLLRPRAGGSPLADAVLGGEMEEKLVELVREGALSTSSTPEQPAARDATVAKPGALVHTTPHDAAAVTRTPPPAAILERLDFATPSREALPSLDRYAHLVHDTGHAVAGHVESSRGCLHHCRHCPIAPIYAGRLFVVPRDTVLEDVRNQVRAGARHITFGDADFLNGPAHSLRIAREMHAEFPDLTFDFTAKVEHIRRHRDVVAELGQLGALFMVSAVESLNDRVLAILDKGHTQADVYEALSILRDAHIVMRPSLLPFTPWSTFGDFIELLDFAERENLIEQIDPVQFTIRLLVPHGSVLADHPEMKPHRGAFDEEHLSYKWVHPDPRMDALQSQLSRLVEEATSRGEDPEVTFYRIRLAAASTAKAPRRRRQRPPRLTESWFC